MVLNKCKGQMFDFISHTWNPIKGKCSHDCQYCYMKVWKQKPLRLEEKEFKDDLGSGNFIFVGSSTDMFADDVKAEWIMKVLNHCNKFNNTYLFQTKNPIRYHQFLRLFPSESVFGTTLETNRNPNISNTPSNQDRATNLDHFPASKKMVTIEPIIDFDLVSFVLMIKQIKPNWVNIGADSKGHGLIEPDTGKINELISQLKCFTEVKIKNNLKRLGVISS